MIWRTSCSKLGRSEEALARYRRAIEIDPEYAEAHNNLGLLLDELDDRPEAAAHFRKVLEIDPKNVQAHNNLGVLSDEAGHVFRRDRTFPCGHRAGPQVRSAPRQPGSCLLSQQGQNAAATAEFRTSLRLQPDQPQVLRWLAWTLATAPEDSVRSGKEAVELAEKAVQLTSHRDATVLNALAAAYAESGRFAEAAQTARGRGPRHATGQPRPRRNPSAPSFGSIRTARRSARCRPRPLAPCGLDPAAIGVYLRPGCGVSITT